MALEALRVAVDATRQDCAPGAGRERQVSHPSHVLANRYRHLLSGAGSLLGQRRRETFDPGLLVGLDRVNHRRERVVRRRERDRVETSVGSAGVRLLGEHLDDEALSEGRSEHLAAEQRLIGCLRPARQLANDLGCGGGRDHRRQQPVTVSRRRRCCLLSRAH